MMSATEFHDELRWCITQLELGLSRQDPESRQAAETVKILKILRSCKAPLVKKRQAMRSALGDYRKKMKESEKKFLSGIRNSKFQPASNSKSHHKSKFLRQSHSKTSEREVLPIHLNCLHIGQSDIPSEDTAPLSQTQDMETSNMQNRDLSNNFSTHSTGASSNSGKIPNEKFHFVPTDNSFSFGFSVPCEDEADVSEEPAVFNKEAQGNQHIPPNGDGCANNEVVANIFKYEKSDNSFCFNFNQNS